MVLRRFDSEGNNLCPLQPGWNPLIMKARHCWWQEIDMEAKRKVGKNRKLGRNKPGASAEKKDRPWPTLENEVMDELARNIEKKRNEQGSIPYPFNRD